jgi:hypothetical protein
VPPGWLMLAAVCGVMWNRNDFEAHDILSRCFTATAGEFSGSSECNIRTVSALAGRNRALHAAATCRRFRCANGEMEAAKSRV